MSIPDYKGKCKDWNARLCLVRCGDGWRHHSLRQPSSIKFYDFGTEYKNTPSIQIKFHVIYVQKQSVYTYNKDELHNFEQLLLVLTFSHDSVDAHAGTCKENGIWIVWHTKQDYRTKPDLHQLKRLSKIRPKRLVSSSWVKKQDL